MRVAPTIELSEAMRAEVEKLARGRRTAVRLAMRAKIILLAADGLQNKDIATELGVCRPAVGEWRRRFAESGIAGIAKDATRPGRPRKNRQKLEQKVVKLTTQSQPAGATHWSTRTLAAELGVDHVFVHRVWKAHGLQPHRVRSFKLSRDPRFVEKLTDVVGLYTNPPEHAIETIWGQARIPHSFIFNSTHRPHRETLRCEFRRERHSE